MRAWLKKVGDAVKQDEPLVELETDKVAVEVPAPADGVLTSIALTEGDEAAPGAVRDVGLRASSPPFVGPKERAGSRAPLPAGSRRSATSGRRNTALPTCPPPHRRQRPRRVTYRRHRPQWPHHARGRRGALLRTRKSAKPAQTSKARRWSRPARFAMRKAIAAHMAHSVAIAPHVTAVFDAGFLRHCRPPHQAQRRVRQANAPLTFSAYIIRAAAEAMKVSPNVNARWHDDFLEVFEDANIGMGVALGERASSCR